MGAKPYDVYLGHRDAKIAGEEGESKSVRFTLKKLRMILYQSRVLGQLNLNALKELVEM
jgi:hypothetical protein